MGNDIDKLFEKIKEFQREVENIKQFYGTYTSTYRILTKLSKQVQEVVDTSTLLWYCYRNDS